MPHKILQNTRRKLSWIVLSKVFDLFVYVVLTLKMCEDLQWEGFQWNII